MKKFTVSEAVTFGWQTTLDHAKILLPIILLISILTVGPDYVADLANKNHPYLALGVNIAAWVLQIILSIGLVRISLQLYEHKPVTFDDLFASDGLFLKYLFASILSLLITIIGLILLVVPGIIWAVRLQFAPYFVVDKRLEPFDALSKSWEATRGHVGQLLLLTVTLVLINLVGVLLFGVGLLITIPLSMLASVYAYRKLTK